MTPRICVQSVLFGNDPGPVERAVRATANSARLAQKRGSIGEWSIALGDCSPEPILSEAAIAVLRDQVVAAGGELRYEFFASNQGHGGGHNRLAASGDSELLLILNPDAMLGADSIGALAETIAAGAGVVDGRQIPLDHAKHYDPLTGDQGWASGACMMIDRALFDAVGRFDHATFFLYCDDVDLSWRARLAGARVCHQPAARVFHDKRLNLDSSIVASDAERYYSAEAAVLLAIKYSRRDVADRLMRRFRRSEDAVARRVATEIEERTRSGRLPTAIDPRHRVGEFVAGNYTRHRW